jgi:hypothetical protein
MDRKEINAGAIDPGRIESDVDRVEWLVSDLGGGELPTIETKCHDNSGYR